MFTRKKALQSRIDELEKELAESDKENKRLRVQNDQLNESNESLTSDLEAAIGKHGRTAVDCNNILRLQKSRMDSAYAVLRIAHSTEHTMDDVLESILQYSRRIGDHRVRALLYEVHPVNRAARKIINEEIEQGHNPVSDRILHLKSDSSHSDGPEYLTIKKGTVLGDSFYYKKPVLCAHESQDLDNVIYGEYDTGRAGIGERASFPIFNPRTKEIVSFVIIEQEKPLKDYEVLYVQSFVHLASLALTIKQDYDYDTRLRKMTKEGAHNLKSSLSILYEAVATITDCVQMNRFENLPRYASTMKRASDTIAEVMNHIQTGKVEYKYSDLSPEAIIQDAVEDSQKVYSNINFHCDFDTEDRSFLLAKEPFVMALQNIIRNTSQQAESNGMDAEVYISTCIRDDQYRVTIKDTAGGMPSDVYETFEKGGHATTKADGTGTGIKSVFDTFHKMGFDIEMNNRPGVGLAYYIQKKL
ncbi:MAG: ATP-binding protein [Nanoarchaeota archaeon]